MAPKLKFTEGERVLCYHGPLLYEAKCIKSQVKDKAIRYYIHYSGWNKNWDEWVPEGRVLKYNEANVKQKEELALTCDNSKKTKAVKTGVKKEKEASDKDSASVQEKSTKKPKESVSATSPSTSTVEVDKKKKSRAEQNVVVDDSVTNKVGKEIVMPPHLKVWLIKSIKKVNEGYLLKIPARKTVDEILEEYTSTCKSEGLTLNQETGLNEIISGIRLYFNTLLRPKLLTSNEKPQYAQLSINYPDKKPSQLYGSFHLLRLFVKLSKFLSDHPYDPQSWDLLRNNFVNFLLYLHKESANLFSTHIDFETEITEKP